MKKYANILIIITTIIILFLILLNKNLVNNTIIIGFTIWFNNLLPSMMPMFIISDILINYNFVYYLPNKLIRFISKLFNISNNSTLILIISIISGYPINAFNIISSYENNLISKEEANHLLLFNNFPNPLFVINTVGNIYLNNNKYGLIILCSIILSNIIIGILFRKKNTITNNNSKTSINKKQVFTKVLSNTIKKTANSLLNISITITLFLILSTLITNLFNLNNYLSLLIRSILEITSALSFLSKLNISDTLKVILSTGIISFSGLSIHMQIISILDDKIPYKNYLIGRIYSMMLSSLISFILLKII